jgi:hypothetical protein
VELLFDVAEDLAPDGRGQPGRVAAEDADLAFAGLVEAEDELEKGALAGTGTAGDGDHFPSGDGEREVAENIFFPAIAEGGVVDDQRCRCLVETGAASPGLDGFGKKVLQAADAGDGRLDVLDFHADAFQRREDAAHIGDEGDDAADGHAEDVLQGRAADGQGHHQADDDCTAGDDDGRIDGVAEIAPFHGVETGPYGPAIALAQVAFLLARVDRADIADRFRDELVRPAHGDAVVPLGLEHALLEVAGQEK